MEIKYRLISRSLDIAAAKGYFTGDDEGLISIKQITVVLEQYPFAINNEDKRVLLARYFVEDADQPILYYDENKSSDVTIVRSILQQSIPKYSVWTEADHSRIK